MTRVHSTQLRYRSTQLAFFTEIHVIWKCKCISRAKTYFDQALKLASNKLTGCSEKTHAFRWSRGSSFVQRIPSSIIFYVSAVAPLQQPLNPSSIPGSSSKTHGGTSVLITFCEVHSRLRSSQSVGGWFIELAFYSKSYVKSRYITISNFWL